MKKLIIICGATATGKSDIAVRCAEKYNGEIISADSMQIYKHMDIGTAKVTEEEKQGIPHYMLDVVEPYENYSVAEYQQEATRVIDEVISRDKTPIIVGGTGLYINSLIYDYSFGQTSANTSLRDELKLFAQEHGNEALHDILRSKSEEAANRLHPNDVKRVIRAIELADAPKDQTSEQKIIRPYVALAVNTPREELYDKINKRVDIMFDLGLEKEIKDLIDKHDTNFDCQSMKAIGYKEFYDYFEGNCSIDDVKELIKKNSRNYAKRQFTWFRKMPGIVWCDSREDAINRIEELI